MCMCVCMHMCVLSPVQLFITLWIVALQFLNAIPLLCVCYLLLTYPFIVLLFPGSHIFLFLELLDYIL